MITQIVKTSFLFLATFALSIPQAYGGSAGQSSDLRIDIRNRIPGASIPYPNLELGGGTALGTIVSNGVQAIIVLSGVAVLLYLIWGGFNWLTAGGDKAQVESARNRITNALVGMAIIASVWVIYGLVDNFFGIGNLS